MSSSSLNMLGDTPRVAVGFLWNLQIIMTNMKITLTENRKKKGVMGRYQIHLFFFETRLQRFYSKDETSSE
jgi:hypothetical protein